MSHTTRWAGLVLLAAGLQLAGCSGARPGKTEKARPATVEPIDGTDLRRLILTERAAERLAIATAPVREARAPRGGGTRRVVPYGAVLYGTRGETWVYTSPEPRTFVRQSIGVDYIDGEDAVLTDGPPSGTLVVTVGAAELYGTEFEIGH